MTAIPQIEKTQFRNEFGGWIGVVVIGPKGDDRGASVEPGGTVWLSEAEQRLTANAPRDPKDNPFIAQTHIRRNPDTGETEEYTVTPLVVCSENRYVPADVRPIPATTATPTALQHVQTAARGDEPVVLVAEGSNAATREQEVTDSAAPLRPGEPPVPRRAAEAAAAAQGDQETAQSTSTTAPGDGTYGGEETGAAVQPSGDAPEGGYQSSEEVGTPVQSQTVEGTEQPQTEQPGGDPAPWNG